jgi:hypothetical protein
MMENFNTDYAEKVNAYIKSRTTLNITKPDGSEWKLYVYGEGDVMCVTQAPEYRIPPEIRELISIGRIPKLHAYTITFELSTFLNWDNMIIDTFCGVSWRGHLRYTERVDVTAFNVLDWVIFSEIDSKSALYALYVNCNVQSPHYGQVMLCIDDDDNFGAQFHIIGNTHDFIAYITEWMSITGTAGIQMSDCLDVCIGMHAIYDKARKYGIVTKGETLTIRTVLSNADTRIWTHYCS